MPMACLAGSRVSTTAVAVTATKLRMVNCRNSMLTGLFALLPRVGNLLQPLDLFSLHRLPLAQFPHPRRAGGGVGEHCVHQEEHNHYQAHLDRRLPPALLDDDGYEQRYGRDRAHRGHVVQAFEEIRSEEHTSELQSHVNLVCRLLLEKKKK